MLSKKGMLAEDLRIQIGSRSYHNLAHYSPNCRFTGPSIYGAFNSFTSDVFEYESGKPAVAKFMPAFAGLGNATKRIRIPISRMRKEISDLEDALWKAVDDESNVKVVRVIGEGNIQLRVNEQAERIKELIKQRKDFLKMYVDMPRELEQHYAGIKLTKYDFW